jgi:hypothetical protein
MSRGLGELEIMALWAFHKHAESHAAGELCRECTAGGFIPIYKLRRLAWPGTNFQDFAPYRGTPEAHRRNYPGAFKRALDRMVRSGYAEYRWQSQYRLTEKGLSVQPQVLNTYPAERLTTAHSAQIEAQIETKIDRWCAEHGIPRLEPMR